MASLMVCGGLQAAFVFVYRRLMGFHLIPTIKKPSPKARQGCR
jgi:hypothetical protein